MTKVQIQVSMRNSVRYPARYRISGRYTTGYEIKKTLILSLEARVGGVNIKVGLVIYYN